MTKEECYFKTSIFSVFLFIHIPNTLTSTTKVYLYHSIVSVRFMQGIVGSGDGVG